MAKIDLNKIKAKKAEENKEEKQYKTTTNLSPVSQNNSNEHNETQVNTNKRTQTQQKSKAEVVENTDKIALRIDIDTFSDFDTIVEEFGFDSREKQMFVKSKINEVMNEIISDTTNKKLKELVLEVKENKKKDKSRLILNFNNEESLDLESNLNKITEMYRIMTYIKPVRKKLITSLFSLSIKNM